MKKTGLKVSALLFALGLMFAPLSAQDEGTYIDNFGPKDSSYTEESVLDFDAEEAPSKEGSSVWIYVAIGAAVVGGVAFMAMKKKK